MPLFDPKRFALYEFECGLPANGLGDKLVILGRLRRRRADGTLLALTETRIEQSFNERLFAEVFDYRTLLSHGEGDYHLKPKGYHASTNRFDDFSLGFFGPLKNSPSVSAEFKSPGANLDAAQTGSAYGGVTVVEQAFRAAANSVQWIIVSNYEELRLYSADDSSQYERFIFDELMTERDVARAYVMLSRHHLLGDGERISPLLAYHLEGMPVLIAQKKDKLRLVHEARCYSEEPAGLPPMDDALRDALQRAANNSRWGWPKIIPGMDPDLVGDRLVVEALIDGEPVTRIDFTRNGIFRLQEYVDTEGTQVGTPDKSLFRASEIARSQAMFTRLAGAVLDPVFGGTADFCWRLLDSDNAICVAEADWSNLGHQGNLHTDSDILETRNYEIVISSLPDAYVAGEIERVCRELLFAFTSKSTMGRLMRIKPASARVEAMVSGIGAL
tara:strand:- start:4515 stop:5846 length:1332 start_codon:yes stop_codon:yes gene_type:complete